MVVQTNTVVSHKKMKKYFLIIITIFTAFAFSSYAGKNIFLSNSPRVNPNYLANLQLQFKKNVNNIYLAFSSLKKIGIKKDIAVVPTKNGNINFVTGVPNVIKTGEKFSFAKIDPATIPTNLFKTVSKGVSAYEGDDANSLLKIKKGTTHKLIKITLPDGRVLDGIDFSGQ